MLNTDTNQQPTTAQSLDFATLPDGKTRGSHVINPQKEKEE